MSKTSNMSCPPAALNCDPDLRAATKNYFDLRNKLKSQNFIMAEVTASQYLKFYVENLPKTVPHTGCPGQWLFQVVWDHFAAEGVRILGIRGDWTFGDNLLVVNQLTANNAMTLEEAAKRTWTVLRANDKCFAQVTILDQTGGPGSYNSVDVVFLP